MNSNGHGGARDGSGRPEGALSEKTKAWDELGDYIVNKGAVRYMEHLDSLKNDEFVQRFESILDYFKPRQARQSIELDVRSEQPLFPDVRQNGSSKQAT